MAETYEIRNAHYALVQCTCGVWFLIPQTINDQALAKRGPSGRQVWCPNGHSWHYIGETEADKMRRERDRAVQEQARLADELAAAMRAKDRAQAETKRVKRRATAALCPCCNRHFSNVERHMKTKHPDVVKTADSCERIGGLDGKA